MTGRAVELAVGGTNPRDSSETGTAPEERGPNKAKTVDLHLFFCIVFTP